MKLYGVICCIDYEKEMDVPPIPEFFIKTNKGNLAIKLKKAKYDKLENHVIYTLIDPVDFDVDLFYEEIEELKLYVDAKSMVSMRQFMLYVVDVKDEQTFTDTDLLQFVHYKGTIPYLLIDFKQPILQQVLSM